MTAFNARQNDVLAYDILGPETGRKTVRQARPRNKTHTKESIIDAEFVTLGEPAARKPGNDNAGFARPPAKPALLSVMARLAEQGERHLAQLSVDRFSALVAALVVAVFVLAGGLSGFFATEPAPAPLQPLSFTHANLTPQEANGMRLLAVNGIVVNNSENTLPLPPIRADLMNGSSLIASVIIDPPIGAVKPGHSHGFATRIVHLGGKTPELKLSFARADVTAP